MFMPLYVPKWAAALFIPSLLLSVVVLSQDLTLSEFEAQESWNDDQQVVWAVIVEWNRAFAENDSPKYFRHIDDEITVITPGNPYRIEGIVHDRAEFEFALANGSSKVAYFQMLQPLVRVYGDAAVVTYYSRGYYGASDGQTRYFKETNVLSRQSGVWKIVHIHLSD
jgi:ketosteroid isomerase-like protein